MLMLSKEQRGFTIVELLIVVVVIAILAAISTVAFSSVQDRAEIAKTASAVRQYREALSHYRTDNGQYPITGAFCLGNQYGTFTGGTTAGCRYSTAVISNGNGSAGRDALKPYMDGQTPMPSTKVMTSGSTEFVGGHFYGSSYNYRLDGNRVVAIEYYVKGNTCPVGPVYANTPPNFSSPAVARSSGLSDGSRCYLLLPDD